MFKNDNNGLETIIGPNVKVEGDFVSQGNMSVEGIVSGTISTAGNLYIGEQAKVTANVEAGSAQIAGHLKGNVVVHEKLELTPTSQVQGDVSAKILVVMEGAQINGHYQMGSVPQTANVKERGKKIASAE
ncbi:MAG: polymer-forming cytoskeletal protein [Patescibacteria group bacterium]